jgi:hypothetical protein
VTWRIPFTVPCGEKRTTEGEPAAAAIGAVEIETAMQKVSASVSVRVIRCIRAVCEWTLD